MASYGSGQITLSTPVELADNTSPAQDFIEGCFIRVYDASATPPFSSSERLEVSGVVGSVGLKLAGTPSTTPAAGDLVVLDISGDVNDTNDIGADVEDFAFGADDEYVIGQGTSYERAGTRWT